MICCVISARTGCLVGVVLASVSEIGLLGKVLKLFPFFGPAEVYRVVVRRGTVFLLDLTADIVEIGLLFGTTGLEKVLLDPVVLAVGGV